MKPHGSRTRYVANGCRCDDCREAHRAYAADLRAQKALNEWTAKWRTLPQAPEGTWVLALADTERLEGVIAAAEEPMLVTGESK